MVQLAPLVLALLFLAPVASAYELKRDASGTVVHWKGQARFVVDAMLATQLGEPKAMDAVHAAIDTLDAGAPGLALSLEQGSTSGVGFDFEHSERNQNQIVAMSDWAFDPAAIAVTLVTVDGHTHQILDADIALNTASRRFAVVEGTGEADVDDLQNTLDHELGHALGLAHNETDPDAVMFPSAAPGECTKRSLSKDDVAALGFLYPDGGSTAADGSSSPQVGCSAGGGRASLWVLLLCAPLFFYRRGPRVDSRKGLREVRLALGLTVGAALLPLAAVAAPRTRSDAPAERAELVATAEVVSARTLPPEPGTRVLMTELDLAVRQCLKGDCGTTVRVRVAGGTHQGLEQTVEGMPVPAVGEKVGVTLTRSGQPVPVSALYRLEQLRDFTAFARGISSAHLPLSLTLPGSATTSLPLSTRRTPR